MKRFTLLIDEANINSSRVTILQINQSINIDKDKILELALKLIDEPDVSTLTNVLEKTKHDLEKRIEKMEKKVNKLKEKMII